MNPINPCTRALACGILTLSSVVTAFAAETVGINFVSNYPIPRLSGELAQGTDNWYDLGPGEAGGSFINPGTAEVDDHLTVTWHAAVHYAAGQEQDSEQQLYRVYLDDGDGGNSYEDGDGIGASVQITGLDAWMAANGLSGYYIRSFHGTDTNKAQFQPVTVRAGVPAEFGSLLDLPEILTFGATESGNGYFPSGINSAQSGTRARGQSTVLKEGAITLTIPARNGNTRGTLTGLMLVGVKGDPALVLPPPLTRPLASTTEFTVPVFNAGPSEVLSVYQATVEGIDADKFTVLDVPGDLAPGESGNIRLAFDAGTATGTVSAVLKVTSNDSVVREHEITGQILDPVIAVPGIVDFAPNVREAAIPIRNEGRNGELAIEDVTITGDLAELFSVVDVPYLIAPGETGVVKVACLASEYELPVTATLTVRSDDPQNPQKTVYLRADNVMELDKVGINFTNGYQNPSMMGKYAYETGNWTDLGRTSYTGFNTEFTTRGTGVVNSLLTVRWFTSNDFSGGKEDDFEQQVYRVYLDDWDRDGTYQVGDGIGVSVEITGLGEWMAANNFSGYTIRAFRGTNQNNATFHDISVRRGVPVNGGELAELEEVAYITTLPENMGGGWFPTDPELQPEGSRGFGDSGTLTEPAITLTIPSTSGSVRGTLAGLLITGIPGNGEQPQPPAQPLAITAFSRDAAGNIQLTWSSEAGKSYTIETSDNLTTWTAAASNIPGQAGSTTWTGTLPGQRLFLRVKRN